MVTTTPLLTEVAEVLKNREGNYSDPTETFDCIAKLWSIWLGVEVKITDVPMMMILLKIAREKSKPQHDNRVDIIGYTDNLDTLIYLLTVK